MNTADQLRQYIVSEFLPGGDPAEITDDLDLLNSGLIDSLGLLKLIAWVELTFDVDVDDVDLDPENFRDLRSIEGYVTGASTSGVA